MALARIWPGATRRPAELEAHAPAGDLPSRSGTGELLTGTGPDQIRWPTRLAERITYFAGAVGSHDFPPTDQMQAVYDRLHQRVEACAAEFAETVESGLTSTNRALDTEGMPGLVRVQGKEPGSR